MVALAAVLGAGALSFSAIFFALADVSPATGAFFRAFYALPALFVIYWLRRNQDQRGWKARGLAFVAGVLLAVDIVAWHAAILHIGTGLATLLVSSQVLIVALVAWVVLGEKPAPRVMGAIPLVLVGVALVSGLGREDAFGSQPLLGTILGVSAAVFYAGFILGIRRANRSQAPAAGPLLEATAAAALTTALLGPLVSELDLVPSWPSHGWLVALAMVAQVGGWLLISYALPRLPAAETATVIVLQPVLTMGWGALLFSERPSLVQLTGAALVLTGVSLVALRGSRRRQQVAPTG